MNEEIKLNDYNSDDKGYYKIINGNKIYQIEEKNINDKKTNDAINSFRNRPEGMTMIEWLNSQY